MNKNDLVSFINFCLANGIDEIYCDQLSKEVFAAAFQGDDKNDVPIQSTSYIASTPTKSESEDLYKVKINSEAKKINTKINIDEDIVKKGEMFIKLVANTDHAISSLAYRFFQSNNMKNNQSSNFLSLSDIVEQARLLAAEAKDISSLRKIVEEFDGCNLKKMATNTVFGDGNPNADIMLIGEAPGNHEDLNGIPFCGDSGKLLDEMFLAIGLTRKELYISNVIFWRPPGNRRPTAEELAICRPFVERHLQLVKPKIIVLVGATAMESLLSTQEPISKMRGKFLDFAPEFLDYKAQTFTIFHPSYLLRQPTKKKVAWLDMLNLQNCLMEL